MTFTLPVHVQIEAPSVDKAVRDARELQKLLGDSIVKVTLQSAGIELRAVQVFQPRLG